MEKIKKLLEQAGVSSDLTAAICESLVRYRKTVTSQLEEQYSQKLQQAKQVCLEETDSYKRELARRIGIFCETKVSAIESQLARNAAIGEAEAMTKLKSIKEMLAGIQVNGERNGQTPAVVESYKRRAEKLAAERNMAVEKANRSNAIAEKVMKQNRQLIAENRVLQKKGQGGSKPVVTESRNGSNRIDASRNSGRSQTTRPTLRENQDRRPPRRPQSQPRNNGVGVNEIANSMDEEL